MIAPALYASERDDWNTPEVVLERVRAFAPIVLDPCSNAQSIVGAREEWRLERGQDGLAHPWHSDHGVCFVNPSYGRELLTWAQKMAFEGRRGVEIIGLVPARTDTEWFQSWIMRASAICFWKGRIKFGAALADKKQTALFGGGPSVEQVAGEAAPFPSALPYFGQRPRAFARAFDSCGWVVRL